ncbi:hypothetical protein ES708_21625 [subsurface metagenome]
MANSIQNGIDFFGRHCERGKVLFIEQDEAGELLKQHRDTMGKPHPLLVAKRDIVWEGNHFCEDLDNTLYVEKPDVVVIDSYTSLSIADITRPESGLVFDELRRKARQYKCAMCIVHHVNLGGKQMGSSLHKAKVDSMIALLKSKEGDNYDRINVNQEKIRGTRFDSLVIKFFHSTLEMTQTSSTIKDQVRELFYSDMSDTEILDEFPSQRDTVRRYLRELRNT